MELLTINNLRSRRVRTAHHLTRSHVALGNEANEAKEFMTEKSKTKTRWENIMTLDCFSLSPLSLFAFSPQVFTMLEVDGLSKSFGGVQALTNVSFAVAEGEIVGLIGPNGAGKTTCFNLINGLLPPSAGGIRLGGTDMVGLPPYRRAAWGSPAPSRISSSSGA